MGWFDLSEVEWLGVAIATLAAYIVSFVWYHQRALGSTWSRIAEVDPADLRDGRGTHAVFAVPVFAITAAVMCVVQAELLIVSIAGGLLFGAVLGLVLRLTWGLMHGAQEFRPVALTLIDSFHDMAALAVIGAVLGSFL